MSRATTLWHAYQKGREPLGEVCESLIRSMDEQDFEREIDSMPREMLIAFAAHVAPSGVDASGPQWDELSFSMLEIHAFEFQFEKAQEWKVNRLRKLDLLCRQRLSTASGLERSPAPTQEPS